MANKQHLEPAAFRMFRENAELQEIASTLDISAQTLTEWRRRHDWDERRRVYQTSNQATVDKLRRLLADLVAGLDNLDDDKASDKIVKVTAAIERLDRHFDWLGSVLRVSEEWIKYAATNDDVLFKKLQEHLAQFLAHARQTAQRVQ